MHKNTFDLKRLILIEGACIALVAGGFAPVANGSAVSKDEDEGTIKVCKEVDGKTDKDDKFKFRIRERDDGKVVNFSLEDGDCKSRDVPEGEYRVTERDLPDGCEVDDIEVKPSSREKNTNIDKGTADVKVKEDKTTKVTYTNTCDNDDDNDNSLV